MRSGGPFTHQLCRGRGTHIYWTAREIVLPTIPDSPASGAIIRVAGLEGRMRGMKFKLPDGASVRPSLVILDDPQADESARSAAQCQERESIRGALLFGTEVLEQARRPRVRLSDLQRRAQ